MHTVFRCRAELRGALETLRRRSRTIGLAPTMGHLHTGLIELVSCVKVDNDIVVVSIFVNPLQVGANEDLSKYSRDLDRDTAML